MKFSIIIIILFILMYPLFLFENFPFLNNLEMESNQVKTIENYNLSIITSLALEKPENLIWFEVSSSTLWEPRDSGEVFIFKNKMWLMGGLNGNNSINNDHLIEYWKAPHFNDIWNSEDGIRWVKIVEHATFSPVEGQELIVFQNKLWKIGSINYDARQVKNDVWYSENGIDWFKVKNIPWKPRWDHAVAVFNEKIFLTGGMNLNEEIFNDIWSFSDGINWSLVTNNAPWMPRQGHALKVYKGKLWLIGRLNDSENGGLNDVWFSEDGIIWKKTINNPQWTGREDFFQRYLRIKFGYSAV